jgi:hypothetical protein
MRMAGFITRYLLKPGSTIFVPFGFKRPDPPGVGARRAETCHNAPSPDGRRDRLTNAWLAA